MTKLHTPFEPTEFGKAMAEIRVRDGVALETLGVTCKSSYSYVQQIEAGAAFGNERVLRCIRDELHIDVSLFDLHFYQWGRISEELQFTDLSWAKARLDELREILTIFRARMQG